MDDHRKVLDSIIAAAILGGGAWLVGFVASGDLIRWLGGATAAEVRQIESRLFDLSNLRFTVETKTVTQEAEQSACGPDVIAASLTCGEGWFAGPVFSETYLYQGTRRKYIRLCFLEGTDEAP